MIVFDMLSGELKFIKTPSYSEADAAFVEFGNRALGDISLDMGERTVDESIVDLEFRI